MKHANILIVEDEVLIALDLKVKLESIGHKVISNVFSGEEAVVLAEKIRPDLILFDIRLKGKIDGIEAATRIRQKSSVPIIYMTGNDHLRADKNLLATKPVGILSKPAEDWELFDMIDKVWQGRTMNQKSEGKKMEMKE